MKPLSPAVIASLRARLGLDLAIILAVVLVGLRLFDVYPWSSPLLDLHTYWLTRDGFEYALDPYTIGAYLYAPAFAQVLAPLTALPWPVFAAAWTALICAVLIWLTGRWAFPLVLTVAVALEIYLGQIDLLIAAVIVLGFRYPALWAFPLLTKVAPGIGLLWFAVRREWRALAIAGGATVAISAVSAVLAPEAWAAWLDMLRRSLFDRQVIEGPFIGIDVWLRLPVAVLLIVWGARTDRHWTVPISVLLAMPILWVNVLSLAVAAVALRPEFGLTPARRWLLRQRVIGDGAAAAATPAPAPSRQPAPARERDSLLGRLTRLTDPRT
ncbi:MAG TPA: glycosyltransferase family 87 protein [Candidatus Deferrimicrobiaceae bacterium]|nr:glycosyltransferase family 87 protein [Candidatus Deferrimicrobiaceae bacterium]